MIKETYSGEALDELISFFKLPIKGVLHVGAHKCEELNTYLKHTNMDSIFWVEAIPSLVEENLNTIPNLNIINAVVSNQDGKEIEFKIANKTNCSSLLSLKQHKEIHPHIEVADVVKYKTKTLKTLFLENNLSSKFNLLTLDLQGAELLALQGLENTVDQFDYIYTEIFEKEIYENCCLLEDVDQYLFKFGFERKYLYTLNHYGNALYIKNGK